MASRLSVIACFISLGILLLGVIVVHNQSTAAADERRIMQQTIDAQQIALLNLQSHFQELSNQLADLPEIPFGNDAFSNDPSLNTENAAQPDIELLHSTLSDVCESLFRLEYIVDSSGLDRTAGLEDGNPIDIASATTAVSLVRAKIQDQFSADRDEYGDIIVDLYTLARARWIPNGDNSAREDAFKTLTEQYPEANLTAMVTAERAIAAGLNGNVKAVADYYSMLSDNPYSGSVITERGIEPMPALEYYLARWYISKKQYANAQPLIESLQQNFSGDKIFNIAAETRWQSGSKVLHKLDNLKRKAAKPVKNSKPKNKK